MQDWADIGVKLVGIGTVMFVLAIIGPLIMFWSINQLFQIDISLTFWNWLAAVGLIFCFRGGK